MTFGRYYGISVLTCEPADPASKGGVENAVKLAKADIVPTETNLLPQYGSFADVEAACSQFVTEINARVHRMTGRVWPNKVAGSEYWQCSKVTIGVLSGTRRVTQRRGVGQVGHRVQCEAFLGEHFHRTTRHQRVKPVRPHHHRRSGGGYRMNATTTTTAAVLPAEVEALMRGLRLPHARAIAADVLATARAQRWDPTEVIKALLTEESAGRARSMLASRRKAAGFPTGKTFDVWDPGASSIPLPTQQALQTLEWVGRRENLVVCGPAGTGKTFSLEALGQKVIEAGMPVAWFTLEQIGVLVRAHRADDSPGKAVAKIVRAELVVIDDVGLLPVGADAAEGSTASSKPPTNAGLWRSRRICIPAASTSSCPKRWPPPPSTDSCTTRTCAKPAATPCAWPKPCTGKESNP